ncbi:MAG TPA: DNA polymerase I [Clostridia bacterium]|jgi:DNA polymerase-1|nr:DNA polymerase I [Clostridiaceae bacterium]HOF25886.1 DNA polymerase I [Clostridia bacterium]HOM33671.1 DNA polymerase I [Clostridia bacterium]HOR88911.1 DNA polymerase I [Clostridia bacterium]HOT71033.1 DNA polymerase I [Clostridia bacterium]
MKKLLLIDGNSILNRAFYGMASNMLVTKDGLFTNAIYGFLNILEKYLNEDNPTHIAVAFDLKGKTFRHEIYEQYKAGRKGMPNELAVQLPVLKDILKAMNITLIEKEGYEADDILGTLSKRASDEFDVVVLTGDRDMLQLITDKCTVKIPTVSSGQKTVNVFDINTFREEYGIEPSEFIDVKALMGDKSDNIPGVQGIGKVGAFNLIKEYKDIDNLYRNIDNIDKPALKEKLIKDKENVFLSKKLAKIDTEVPIDDLKPDNLEKMPFNNQQLLKLFVKLEFNSFIQKFQLEEKDENISESAQHFLEVSDLKDFDTVGSRLFLYYKLDENILEIEIMNEKHQILKTFDKEADNCLKEIFSSDLTVVSHYLKDIFVYCFYNNIKIPEKYYDTATAMYLLDSMKEKYDIDDTYRNHNISGSVNDPKPYKIKYLQKYSENELKTTDMQSLFYDIELPLVEILAYMEYIGIRADREYLLELSEYFDNELNITAKKIFDYAGCTFNINSPKQLGIVLFEQLKLPHAKPNASGGYSTSADVLEKLRRYPIVEEVLYYRTVSKLYSTYAQGLLSAIQIDGRIHSKFNQTVTATGRISSTDPNMQNIPIRTEIGRKIRKAFIPEEGYTIVSGDYSQIELRILAHIADDENMRNAFLNKEDIHASTAAKVFGVNLADVTKEQRRAAKAVNFGIIYGISDFSLSRDINVPVKKAAKYIEDYLNHYSGVKEYMQKIVRSAMENGYVSTIYGRRRYIPELSSPKFQIREFGKRVALNAPIQGSAADIIKIAMIRVYKQLKEQNLKSRLILQVHDELVIETHKQEIGQVKEILQQSMEKGFDLSVPLDIEISVQDSLLKG